MTVDTKYDSVGRIATVSNPHRSAAQVTDGVTTYQYDALDRHTQTAPPDGSPPTSGSGCLPNNLCSSYAGNVTTVTDQALKSRKNQTDGLGRITSVWEDPAGLNYLTSYGYDPLGNLTSVLQAGSHPRTFTYNSLSQLLTATNPESGTLTYTYDNSGNLLTKVAPAPNQTGSATVTTTYTYDALNRITGKTYSDGVTAPVVYAYDQSAPWGSPLTNYIGRLTTEYTSNASGTLTDNLYDYDAMGRVIRRAQCQPLNCAAPSQNAFYTYNLLGSPTSLRAVQTGVLDFTISSSYDAAGRLATVSSSYVDAQHPGTLFTVDASAGYYPGGELKKALYKQWPHPIQCL